MMPGSSTIELVHAAISDLSNALASMHTQPRTASSRQPVDQLASTATTALHELLDIYRATPIAQRVAPFLLPATAPAPDTPIALSLPPTTSLPTPVLSPTTPGAQRVDAPAQVVTPTIADAQRVAEPSVPQDQRESTVPGDSCAPAPTQRRSEGGRAAANAHAHHLRRSEGGHRRPAQILRCAL
jgi:hypothetical protein